MLVKNYRDMPTDKATFPRNKVLHGETHLDSIDSTGVDRGGTGHPAGPALKKRGGQGGSPSGAVGPARWRAAVRRGGTGEKTRRRRGQQEKRGNYYLYNHIQIYSYKHIFI